MSDSLAITLHATAEEVASGSGAAVDLWGTEGVELRRFVRLVLVVSAMAGTSVEVAIETSPDEATWRSLGAFPVTVEAGKRELLVGDCDRYVRASWVVDAAATFALTGTAESTYCSLAELEAQGPAAKVLAGVAQEKRIEALLAASRTAHSRVVRRHKPPILTVGPDVAKAVAYLAAVDLMTTDVGFNPNAAHHVLLVNERDRQDRWLRELAAGTAVGDIRDSTPETREGTGAVATGESRGWGEMGIW